MKRALDKIEAVAHRFNPEQFATWKENHVMILNWIDSMLRSNTISLRTANNFPASQSNGMQRQESNQFPDMNLGVIRDPWVEVEPADQQLNQASFVENTPAFWVASHKALSEIEPVIRATNDGARSQTRNSDSAPN
ncbi:hypothetical protein R1flu_003297 [Riccia fluitans]|uniref:Uncharacterized protein n=1 Tax=Riccia fluitans TaxID=41844 RepID=A0ABD1YBP8_9MARC